MAHHKRLKSKAQRSGCLFCKPHKGNHAPMKNRGTHSTKKRSMKGTDGD